MKPKRKGHPKAPGSGRIQKFGEPSKLLLMRVPASKHGELVEAVLGKIKEMGYKL